MDSAFQYFHLTLEVFFLDLLLSGDNAVVIALACRSLPAQQKRRAMMIGTAIAIALRIVLTLLASAVLQVPVLKLLGGITLAVIAIKLLLDDQDATNHGDNGTDEDRHGGPTNIWPVVWTVILADLVMSMDNVVALAAVGGGNMGILALGLLFSVPILMFGSWYVTALLIRYPLLTRLGGAMLGWFAGSIAVSDPLYASWVEHQSPALSVIVPALVAVFVLVQSRIINSARAVTIRPEPRARLRSVTLAGVVPGRNEVQEGLFSLGKVKETAPSTPPPRLELSESAPEVPASVSEAEQVNSPAFKAPQQGLLTSKSLWRAGMWSLMAIGVGFILMNIGWMPAPATRTRYDCPSKDISVFYKNGVQKISLVPGANSVNGVVRYDNQIEWEDATVARKTLGFAPPTRVLYADAKTLRMSGAMIEDITCHAH